MSPTATDPVLHWTADAAAAEHATGIPASVLLGLVKVESGGREGLTSRAGAGGLTQFIPGTAAHYHVDVRPGHSRSQLMGAALYLRDLGYETDPHRALAAFNGGPGNVHLPETQRYANEVLAAARHYQGLDGITRGRPAAGGAAPAPAGGSDLFSDKAGGLKYAVVWIAVVIAGATAAGMGVNHALGGAPARAGRRAGKAAATAAVA